MGKFGADSVDQLYNILQSSRLHTIVKMRKETIINKLRTMGLLVLIASWKDKLFTASLFEYSNKTTENSYWFDVQEGSKK